MAVVTSGVARRPRAYVRVSGPDAEDYLQRMVSNDVSAEICDALLLTPKARVIAPLRVWRRAEGDFLLLTEPELGDVVRATLLRSRFAAKCEIELEEHTSSIVFGDVEGIPNPDYGAPDLTDNDWLYGGDPDAVYRSIYSGRHGLCPAWTGKLTPAVIRALAVYIHQASFGSTSAKGQAHG